MAKAISGVSSAGFHTALHPAASAAATFLAPCARGMFQRDARRFVLDEKLAPRLGMRGDAAIDAPRLLAEPLEKTGGILHLAGRLGIRLALLGGEQPRELILSSQQQSGGAFQHHTALHGRHFAPRAQRLYRALDGQRDDGGIRTRHVGDFLPRGGIANGDGFPARMPLAVDPR